MLNFGLKDQVILVTGGASGIGRAAARLAGEDGANVVVADFNEAATTATVEEFKKAGIGAYGVSFDVRDPAATKTAIDKVEQEFGAVDGLVACAGIPGAGYSLDLDPEFWHRVMETNLSGVFFTAQAVAKHMVKRGRGSIVTIGSTDALGGHTARAPYASSKHGIIGLTRTLAIEWGQYGVRVNCISPGAVDTPLLRNTANPDTIEHVLIDRCSAGRMCQPEEPARVALFLLSEAASFVSGANIAVDHGLTAGFLTRFRGADTGAKSLPNRIGTTG